MNPRPSSAPRTRDDTRNYHWRRLRPIVYARDGGICHICHKHIDPNLRYPHPMSYDMHHTRGRHTGMDLRFLAPSHRVCNQRLGDPMRKEIEDPRPRGVTRW